MDWWRNDDYMNAAIALGTNRDRSTQTKAQLPTVWTEVTSTLMYMTDGLCRRVVDLPAEEMTRAGFDIVGDISTEDIKKIEDKLKDLNLSEILTDALRWSALFGGSAIIIGANDGGDLETPLNESTVRDIEFLRVVDRFRMSYTERYSDPADRRYGKVKMWDVASSLAASYRVHESRVIIFDGEPVPEWIRESNDGWGMGVLQYSHDHLRRMGTAYQFANQLLERAQQAVISIPDLKKYCSSDAGLKALKNRVDAVDSARSIANAIVIDAQEKYELKNTTFAGVPDVLDRFAEAVSSVTGIPITLLIGRSPAGLSATGKSDLENWYAKVGQKQGSKLRRPIEQIVNLVANTLNISSAWCIEFCPLSVPSDKEQAETEKLRAEAASKYVESGALDPREVREHLKQDSPYPIDDVDLETDPTNIDSNDPYGEGENE